MGSISFIFKSKEKGKKLHERGRALYKLGEYQEAEQMFCEAVQRYEETHGKDHPTTLDCKHGLAWTLYQQEKYREAEDIFHKTMGGCEKILGNDHSAMLDSKHGLAWALYKQKYQESEYIFHKTVRGCEKKHGKDHPAMLDCKHGLAQTLYKRQKYQKAERIFHGAVGKHEKILGQDHPAALDSKHGLAWTLYKQQNYQQAEDVFYQTMGGCEKIHGQNHPATFDCKHGLACTLYKQEKYQEAETIFCQIVQECEKILGKGHPNMLDHKHRLANTLYKQEKCQEAEEILHGVVQEREKIIGMNHPKTLDSKRLLQEVLHTADSSAIMNDTPTISVKRLGAFFPGPNDRQFPYTDSEIYQISALLKQFNFSWSRVPRTYVVLRTIDCLHLLDEFIDFGFSDYWFPVNESSVPDNLNPKMRARFIDAQQLVLSKSMDLEKSEDGRHHYFKGDEPLPFESKGTLGAGGFGQVDKVLSLISFKEYARKRVPRKAALSGRGTEAMKGIVAEIEIIKKLKHRHIVEFVGSYTDRRYLGLIVSPVAEMDFSTYLKKAESPQHAEIQTFFGCLATALQFLHDSQIRHKDIKPGNILIDRGNILFTDFGLALDFADASCSTTAGMVNGVTRRYCAPEVTLHEPRNTSSDIWSLGVVFLEMTVVLKGKTIKWMDDYLETHGSQQVFARSNPVGLEELLAELKYIGSPSSNEVLGWIQHMLQEDRALRLTAAHLVTLITSHYFDGTMDAVFCGICCLPRDNEFSNTSDELDDYEI